MKLTDVVILKELWQESGENTGDFGSNISYLCM
jgi:hypothetical protein